MNDQQNTIIEWDLDYLKIKILNLSSMVSKRTLKTNELIESIDSIRNVLDGICKMATINDETV